MKDMKGEGQVSDYERKLMKDAGKSIKRGAGKVSDFEPKMMKTANKRTMRRGKRS